MGFQFLNGDSYEGVIRFSALDDLPCTFLITVPSINYMIHFM